MSIPSLVGKVVAITRAESKAGEFVSIVKKMGGKPIPLPVIRIVTNDWRRGNDFIDLVKRKNHDYCAFMSATAVRLLFEIVGCQAACSALAQTKIIAVGPKTLAAVDEFGLRAVMPRDFSSQGLIELLSSQSPYGKKIIIPRSEAADEHLARALADMGMELDEVHLYTVVEAEPTQHWCDFVNSLGENKVDCVIFTSASSVRAFFAILSQLDPNIYRIDNFTKVISIGPKTNNELLKHGIKSSEAPEHTIKGATEFAARLIASVSSRPAEK